MITVHQLMEAKGDEETYAVEPSTIIQDALKIMAEKNVGALLVISKGQMVGIFSERDFARKAALRGKCSLDLPVSEFMTKEMITIQADETLEDCMALMNGRRIRHLPVMDMGRLVGMVSMRDVVSAIIARQNDDIDHLQSYIMGQGYLR